MLAQLLERPEDTFRHHRLQRTLKVYIAAVLTIAVLGSATWLLSTGDVLKSTQVLISVLIVSCPCALGIALPMCDEFATARLRRSGLFIKSADIWERLRRVRTIVFDKTGTLTMDVPGLQNPQAVQELDPFAAAALYHLVRDNAHPVARSLRECLLAQHGHRAFVEDGPEQVEESIGQGVRFTDRAGNTWSLGKPAWLAHEPDQNDAGLPQSTLRQNGYLVASFHFSEDVRDDAQAAIQNLQSHNLDTAILSGDAAPRVQAIAESLNLPASQVRANCSPQDKAEWIRQNAAEHALMIGDGANDSLAFDQAICRGTPVVDRSILEASADFFFFGRSLRCLPELWQISIRRRRTVLAVFIAAIGYNCAAITLCLSGHMHPLLAAILMPLSSIATLAISWLGLGRQ